MTTAANADAADCSYSATRKYQYSWISKHASIQIYGPHRLYDVSNGVADASRHLCG
jgi:hypothetical protein